MVMTELANTPQDEMQLSEYFALVPPADWKFSASFDNLPVRLLAYGKVLFQPADGAEVYLKWQIANWLEGQPELTTFLDLLWYNGKPSASEMSGLYAALLRIPMDFVADYAVIEHAGLGRALLIDYNYTDWSYKGRVMYTQSPTNRGDVQIISYEGVEPAFSTHLIEALLCLDSCRTLQPKFVLQKLFAGEDVAD
jgi:hypothetical protein